MKIREQVQYLRVADMARSLAFYRDGLGFEVARHVEDEGGPFFVRLERGGVAIMISNRPSRFLHGADHEHEHGHESHEHQHEHAFHGVDVAHAGELSLLTYVYVDDVDAAHAELVSRGVEPVDAPEEKFYGVREFLVRDPDGYYYAFAQRMEPAQR